MGDDSTDQAISRYREYMREVKDRIAVIERALIAHRNEGTLTGFQESDIELCFLQFRKCLELVMFASLVAHFHAGVDLQRHMYEKEWSASKLLNFLKRTNPDFFPKALSRVNSENGGLSEMIEVQGSLSIREFSELYDRVCGPFLHASRKSAFLGKQEELFGEIEDWFRKICRLLNSHWVKVNEETVFAVLMETNTGGSIQVAIFSEFPSKSSKT